MADVLTKFVIDIAHGTYQYVPLTDAEITQRNADVAAAAAQPPPVDPVADVIAQVVNAPDFDTAKKNLAAYVANRKAA